jgi:hypothetical protein
VIWSFVGLGNTFIVFELFCGLRDVIVAFIINVSVTVINVVSVIVAIHVSAMLIIAMFEVSMQFPEVVITLIGWLCSDS